MILAVDIGNTNITLGGYKDDNLIFVARLATDSKKTADQYAIEIKDVLKLYDTSKKLSGAIISSGVPNVQDSLNIALKKLYNIKP